MTPPFRASPAAWRSSSPSDGRSHRVKFPVQSTGAGKPQIFPSYTLHPVYDETDVFISMAKLKEHANCGVTLASKNIFGITPASIYGDDAGVDEPNEKPTSGRASVCTSAASR